MKSGIFLALFLSSLWANAQEPGANILRVNSHAGSTGDYSSLQDAVIAWVPGDEIWVESVCTGPWSACNTAFENVIIDKPVIIRGPGYFLAENNVYAQLNSVGSIGFVQLVPGSEGCVIAGLTINQLNIYASFTTIERCKLSSIDCFSSNNHIERNYIEAPFAGITALRFSGFSNIIRNNFIGAPDPTAANAMSVEQIGSFPNTFESNTVVGGLSNFQGSTISENIFYNHIFQNLDNNLVSYNLFNLTEPIAPTDLGGEINDLCQVFCDPSNQVNLSSEYFMGGIGDAQWMPLDGSPAFGVASDGTAVGMYDQSPFTYVKSGLSIDPIINLIEISACIHEGFVSLPVNMIAGSGSDTPVLFAEYFFDVDPGVGNGTIVQFGDATLGPLFFAVNIAGLAPGEHFLGVRLIDTIDNFSLTQERSFTIKAEPVVADILGFEYLWDQDDGYDSGIFVTSVSPASNVDFISLILPESPQEGLHQIFFRSIDADGNYGVTQVKTIFLLPPDDQDEGTNLSTDVVSFFTGEDPGIDFTPEFPLSNADDFGSLLNLMFDAEGIQEVNFRVKDSFGNWSTTQVKTYYVLPEEQPTPALDRIEYFVDNDPGYNDSPHFTLEQGTTTFEGLLSIPLDQVTGGYHFLFLRSRDASGDFSTTQGKLVYVMDQGFMAADINNDGVVNITDLLILVSNYGCSDGVCVSDITGDGITNVTDLLAFIQYFGQPGTPPDGP